MIGNRTTHILTTGAAIVLVLLVLSATVFAQANEPVQIAANTLPTATPKVSEEINSSTAALEARIEAQQQEINKLSTLVEKLQALLEPVASAQPMVPSLVGFLPPSSSPSSPAPPAPAVSNGYMAPRELLPDIGHIGAELGFFVGGATFPYKDDNGFATGGFIDLPWHNVPGGKLSYEIMIGMQRDTSNVTSTSGVNVLVNTALNNYLVAAGLEKLPSVTNYLTGPLPVTNTMQERAKVLTVAPFELKYAITKLGRFRPYIVAGLGTYVWIGSENNKYGTNPFNANTALGALAALPVGTSTLGATLNSLLQGSQIGGLAPTSPELAARGVPHGQGNLLFGGQVGGGFEIRITPKLSLGADFRHNQVEGSNASFNTFAFKQGFHW